MFWYSSISIALSCLSKLKDCEAHATYIVTGNDKKALKDLGLLPKSITFVTSLKDSDGNEAITCSYAGTNGQDGQDGTSVTIISTSHSGQITTVYFSDGTSI